MAHRTFVDAQHVEWAVWDVRLDPTTATRTTKYLPTELRAGWLAFEGAGQRRRLAPIPPAWEQLSDAVLCTLLAQAEICPPRPHHQEQVRA